jgi:hypothetical protein
MKERNMSIGYSVPDGWRPSRRKGMVRTKKKKLGIRAIPEADGLKRFFRAEFH